MKAFKILGVVFFLIFNGIGAALYWTAMKDAAHAELIRNDTSQFTQSGAFMAAATLQSPSGETLKSLHYGTECVAFGTRVERHYMTSDSDGDDKENVSQVFETRETVPDLSVVFEQGEANLDMLSLGSLYGEKMESLDDCPGYVPAEMLTDSRGYDVWWEAYEASYGPAEKVFVVAQMSEGDPFLKPHPEFDSVVLFPGDRAGLVQAYEQHGQFQKYGTIGMFIMSLIASGICFMGAKLSNK